MANADWKCLQPEKLDINPNAQSAEDEWKFWLKTFTNFVNAMPRGENALDRLNVLTAYLTAPIYKLIQEETTYEGAIEALEQLFVKPNNEIYARHLLATAQQNVGESIDEFVLRINKLTQNCNFTAVTAQQYKDAMKRDSFIRGISSGATRQRLLENRTLTFTEAYEKARALEVAKITSETYCSSETTVNAARVCAVDESQSEMKDAATPQNDSGGCAVNATQNRTSKQARLFVCYFCGGRRWHPRSRCPAKNATCDFCDKVGHFAQCCLKRKSSNVSSNCVGQPTLPDEHSTTLASLESLQSTCSHHVLAEIEIKGLYANALVDTGSTNSYIDQKFAKRHSLPYKAIHGVANMASSTLQAEICGVSYLDLTFSGNFYKNLKFHVMPNLIADAIIGDDILQQHKSVTFKFEGSLPELFVSSIMPVAHVPFPHLFTNITSNCKPVAVKTRKFSSVDYAIIKAETEKLLHEDRIEPSNSPWRAQPLIVDNGKGKKRMCIDYSQTINLFTQLDAYPLPSIESIVNEVAKWNCISTLDLKSAYHQIESRPEDRPYTAFQSGSELYQWKVLPFGLTNAVPVFQRVMNQFIERHKLKCVNVYLDNITVGRKDQKSHDDNLKALREAAEKDHFTFNKDKCQYNCTQIQLLGHLVGNGVIKLDPERIAALNDLPAPTTKKELQRILGLFSYYSKWVPNYSAIIRPLVHADSFPLSEAASHAFCLIKNKLGSATLQPIDEDIPFTVETDASDFAIAATLNQNNKPVAFHARTLSTTEQKHSSVEKEAYATIEALRKWKYLLAGKHFNLITDQQSVSFMLDLKHSSKIKNDKIQR